MLLSCYTGIWYFVDTFLLLFIILAFGFDCGIGGRAVREKLLMLLRVIRRNLRVKASCDFHGHQFTQGKLKMCSVGQPCLKVSYLYHLPYLMGFFLLLFHVLMFDIFSQHVLFLPCGPVCNFNKVIVVQYCQCKCFSNSTHVDNFILVLFIGGLSVLHFLFLFLLIALTTCRFLPIMKVFNCFMIAS